MLTLDLIINPVIVLIALAAGGITGYVIGKQRLAKSHSRVKQLEEEIMSSHAEILEIQKAYVQLENQLGDQYGPVIPMKMNGKDSAKEKATK